MRILTRAFLLCLIVAGAVIQAHAASSYRLASEDVFTVVVLKHPEFSGDFLIPTDGIVDIPAVGPVKAAGMTISELNDYVKTRLAERLRKPEVSLILKSPRALRIYVLGAVQKPGVYPIKPGWRITEALAAASGIEAPTADCKVSVLHASTGERQVVGVANVLYTNPDANLVLQDGDVVNVEAVEGLPVYVLGKVRLPGMYKLRQDGSGVMEALTMAGGAVDDAAVSRVTITHTNGTTETVDLTPAVLQGKQEPNIKLASGDIVVVPEAGRIAVLGYVNKPGYYSLREGQKFLLTDALGLAQGATTRLGGINAVAVLRTENGKQERLTVNLSNFLKNGDLAQNPEMKAGDLVYVPKTNRLDWTVALQSFTSVGILLNSAKGIGLF